jgi:RluA family pseudouridine synthase
VDSRPILTLLEELERLLPGQSRSDLRRLLADGRVTVNGSVAKIARMCVEPTDAVRVRNDRKPLRRWPFTVVHADDDLLVIDKPAGLITSSTPREKRPTALAIAREWAAIERPRAKVGLVHRLDADASGLLCFSLNNAAHNALKGQFFDHSAGRTYAAVVAKSVTPPVGTIRSLLVEHVDGTVHATKNPQHGRPAITHYQTVAVARPRTLLHVTLETGRKHQIRAHLSGRGWPIVGDRLYDGDPADRLMLAAIRLELAHPTAGGRVVFEAPMPSEFRTLVPSVQP